MESSLHRQLKEIYAGPQARCEVPVAGYRIDALRGRRLFEIQHASLSAIRPKIQRLLESHSVTVVKPLIARKQLVQIDGPDGPEVSRRYSPKRGTLLDVFDELVYFARVFPHARLRLEVPLVEIEEWRYAVPARRRRRRWTKDYAVADQTLVRIVDTRRLQRSRDLLKLLPAPLPRQFDTEELAQQLGVRRWIAQRIAYCLRHCGAVETIGKRGRAWLYAA